MSDLTSLDLVTASVRLQHREISALALTEAYLDRIGRFNPAINAFRHVTADDACRQARASDRRGRRLGPLDGIPIALKDNIDIGGLVTRSGFGPRDDRPAARDAAVVARLRAGGAVVLGHTNMHEGALGATTDNPHYGRTHNPWRRNFTPGGSSGGSAAAVAGRLCLMALGTDTMGSVRLPAAFCGVAGYKPSHDLISNDGIEPLCRCLDQVGPLARSAGDIAVVFEQLAGPIKPVPAAAFASTRIGYLADENLTFVMDDADKAYQGLLSRLRETLRPLKSIRIETFHPSKARRAGLLLCEAEAASLLAGDRKRYPNAFSADFAALLDFGANAGADRLAKAAGLIEAIGNAFDRIFDEIDVLLMPTVPELAFPFDEPAPEGLADLTVLANIAGAPAISLPWLIEDRGLPAGAQLVGRRGSDAKLLALAMALDGQRRIDLPNMSSFSVTP